MNELQAVQISKILKDYAKGIVHQPKESLFMDFAYLLNENFSPIAIEQGLRSLPRGSHFPALADIESASRPFVKRYDKQEKEYLNQYEIEQKRFEMLKETFGNQLGEAGLTKILNKWIEVFGIKDFMPQLEASHIKKYMFLKPALFDLEKASARTKENPSKLFDEFVKIVAESRDKGAK